jgi:hypothetical protein
MMTRDPLGRTKKQIHAGEVASTVRDDAWDFYKKQAEPMRSARVIIFIMSESAIQPIIDGYCDREGVTNRFRPSVDDVRAINAQTVRELVTLPECQS